MKRFSSACCMMVIIALIVSLQAASAQEAESQKWLKEQQSYETPVIFYGKVEDQYGDPVANALLECSVSVVSILGRIKDFNTTTDTHGEFYINRGKGANLYINTITCDGYEFIRDSTVTRMFNFRANRGDLHVADPENPVVFKMRKMDVMPTYLHEGGTDMRFSPENNFAIELDFLRLWAPEYEESNQSPNYLADLRVVANWVPGATTATLAFSTEGAKGAGILGSEKFLGIAPVSGYKDKLILGVAQLEIPTIKYLYVRSRDPLIYSCYEISHVQMSGVDKIMIVSLERKTNLLGDRNLEMAEDVAKVVKWHIQGKVQDAYKKTIHLEDEEKEQMRELIQISRKTAKDAADKIYKEKYYKKSRKEKEQLSTAELLEAFKNAEKKK